MDPDITTISPVNKLHPQDDILATGSSRYRPTNLHLPNISTKPRFSSLLQGSVRACRSIFIWKPKNNADDPTEERTSQKVKEYVYGSGSRKKANGKHGDTSDDDSDGGSDGKNKKAKKTRFTHTAKGKGKSKA
jgi:DNA damage-binding protein 2